jgi:hypothetical protein
MPIPTRWKIAGATAAATGLAMGGLVNLAQGDDGGGAEEIALRDTRPAAATTLPDPVDTTDPADLLSPDGESIDSPLQSADDSPEGGDSVDTPGESPHGESVDSPGASADDSVDGQDSADSPAPPPAPTVVAPTAPPPPAPASVDSPPPAPSPAPPAPASVDSPPPPPPSRPTPAPADSPASPASPASVASAASADSPG